MTLTFNFCFVIELLCEAPDDTIQTPYHLLLPSPEPIYYEGYKVYYTCSCGYEIIGEPAFIVCINQQWNISTPECVGEYMHD